MDHGYGDDDGDGNASDYDQAISSSDEGETGATTTGKLPRFQYPTFQGDDGAESDNDDGDEFQPRRRQGMSQEERLYGVFYKEGMSDDDEQPKRKKPRKPFFKKASVGKTRPAVAPMFVKGAVLKPNKEIDDETNGPQNVSDAAKDTEQAKDSAPSEEELERQRRANKANQHFLNLLKKSSGDSKRKRPRSEILSGKADSISRDQPPSSATQGLGFVASSVSTYNNSVDNPSGGLGLRTEVGHNATEPTPSIGPGYQPAGLGFQRSADSNEQNNSSGMGGAVLGFQQFGARLPEPTTPKRATLDPNLGKWEKHTKGIGAKLLSKMGYTGKGGLGSKKRKNDDTKPITSKPIEVKVRPTSLGLGYGGFKEATHLNKKNEEMAKKVEDKRAQRASTAGANTWNSSLPSTKDLLYDESWRETKETKAHEKLEKLQQTQSKKGSSKPKIVSYQELLEKQKNAANGMKIIDMTGPAPSTDENELADQNGSKQPLAEELLHNIGLLMGTHESRLYSAHQAELASKQKLESMKEDAQNLERRALELQDRHDKLSRAIYILDEIDALSSSEDSNASRISPLLIQLTNNFSTEERLSLKFSQVLLPTLLQPFLQRRLLEEWSPMEFSADDSRKWIKSTIIGVLPAVQMERSSERERFVGSLWNKFVLPRAQEAIQGADFQDVDMVSKSIALYDLLSVVGQEIEASIEEKQIAPRMQDYSFVLPVDEKANDKHSKLRDDVEKSLLLNTVHPKLLRLLSRWKPALKDGKLSNPLDGIILPWLVHLDNQGMLQPILQECRSKVRSAVSFVQKEFKTEYEYLHIAVQIIRPWHGILKTKYIDELVSAYITPPLARSLGKADAIADTRSSEALMGLAFLLHKEGLLSSNEFLSIVEGDFLNPWCTALFDRTQDAGAIAIMTNSYAKWKKVLLQGSLSAPHKSDEFAKGRKLLRLDPIVCRYFFAALLTIETSKTHAKSGNAKILSRPQATNYRVVLSRRSAEERKRINEDFSTMNTSGLAPSHQVRSDANREARARLAALNSHAPTFRDVVEEYAKEREILFQPRIGTSKSTMVDGKQVFLFGNVPVYLDSNVVFALSPNKKWEPISLEELGSRVSTPS